MKQVGGRICLVPAHFNVTLKAIMQISGENMLMQLMSTLRIAVKLATLCIDINRAVLLSNAGRMQITIHWRRPNLHNINPPSPPPSKLPSGSKG